MVASPEIVDTRTANVFLFGDSSNYDYGIIRERKRDRENAIYRYYQEST